jgi:hypothetical protein
MDIFIMSVWNTDCGTAGKAGGQILLYRTK